jgi:hypothetical protein
MSKVHVHDNHDLYGIDHLLDDQARRVIYNSLRVESFGRWNLNVMHFEMQHSLPQKICDAFLQTFWRDFAAYLPPWRSRGAAETVASLMGKPPTAKNPSDLRTRILHRPILLGPQFLLVAPERRRDQTIDLPQSPLRLADMILPIIAFVFDMRFQRLIDPTRHATVLNIVVGLFDRNVVDRNSNLCR